MVKIVSTVIRAAPGGRQSDAFSPGRIRIVDQRVRDRPLLLPAAPKPLPDRDPLTPGGGLGRAHVPAPLPHIDEAVRVGAAGGD